MNLKNNIHIIIIVLFVLILIVGGIIVGAIMDASDTSNGGVAKIVIDSNRYDFGTISMADGLPRHTFTIKNEGTADLDISQISTSCMCTSAILSVDGQDSPKFGMHSNPTFWSQSIAPGQTATLEVIFDPLAHGPDAIGPITRGITGYSNDNGGKNVPFQLTFSGNVVK